MVSDASKVILIMNEIKFSQMKYADRAIMFGLALFALTVNLSVTFAEAGIIISFIGILCKYKSGAMRPKIGNMPLLTAWVIYLGIGVLASITAFDSARAFKYLPSDLIKCWGFFVFWASFQDMSNRKRVVNFFIFGALVAAIIGLWQVAFLGEERAHAFMHPINFAELLALALAFILSIGIRIENGRRRLLQNG